MKEAINIAIDYGVISSFNRQHFLQALSDISNR
ncbi:hypothetical protein DFR35_1249 [Sulfurisoma sediminicola]|uniref:Uncharacterized protein n=1 Tax=Sulfurisoma sediminicola TaxID=1381557 RepID=A0A497XEG5_9PROT|nr:hypothetical protein DFR35_1249 [Sulfurisoma sediminicola]